MELQRKIVWHVLPVLLLLTVYHIWLTAGYMKSILIDEIPFGSDKMERNREQKAPSHSAIHAVSKLEQRRGFLHLFNAPYIVCFFAAKGKWPAIPPFMQGRVDATARTFFSKNDSFIRQFCQKWIAVKECFRPIFAPTTPADVEAVSAIRSSNCTCARRSANEEATSLQAPMVYFDKDHIGSINRDTILNTIEFLESFLPPPTKKTKRKNRVRSRVDEMDIPVD